MSLKITFAGTVLCDGFADARQAPNGLRIGVRNTVQTSKRIRAAISDHFARENTETPVQFSNSIEHADIAAAIATCSSIAAALPKVGLLEIENSDGGIQELTAQLQDHEHWHVGVSSHHRYSFIGGVFSGVPGGGGGGASPPVRTFRAVGSNLEIYNPDTDQWYPLNLVGGSGMEQLVIGAPE